MKLENDDAKYIIAELNGDCIPIVKIQSTTLRDGRIDIRISHIGTQHHYSIHQAKIIADFDTKFQLELHNSIEEIPKSYSGECPIVYTSFDCEKIPSTWDEKKKEISIKLGLDPERHIKYYDNRVVPLGSMSDFYIGGRKLVLKSRKKYPFEKSIIYQLDHEHLFLETYFTINNFHNTPNIEVNTSLGKLGFYFRETLH